MKTSYEINKWFHDSSDIKKDFQLTAMLMEKAGTGGALFRNMYRDFLKENYALIGSAEIKRAYQDYSEIAALWKETENIQDLEQASAILIALSEKEKAAMEQIKYALTR